MSEGHQDGTIKEGNSWLGQTAAVTKLGGASVRRGANHIRL